MNCIDGHQVKNYCDEWCSKRTDYTNDRDVQDSNNPHGYYVKGNRSPVDGFEVQLFVPCLSGSFPKWWIGDHDIRATPLLRSTVRTSDMVVSERFRPRSGFIRRFSPYRAIQAVSWGRDDVLGGNRIGMHSSTSLFNSALRYLTAVTI